MKLSPLALVATLACSTATADEVYFDTVSTVRAVRDSGPYAGVFAGGAAFQDAGFDEGLNGKGFDAVDDNGWFAGIEFGYSFWTPLPLRIAFEAEFTYMDTNIGGEGNAGRAVRGEARTGSAMANVIFQLDLDDHRNEVGDFLANFRPYVGVGAGVAFTDVEGFNTGGGGRSDRAIEGDGEFSFAYQLFAGIEYLLDDTWSVYGEYRRVVISEVAKGAISDLEHDLWALGIRVNY